jgi:hypothetical protein
MAACLDAKELNEMKARAEGMAELFSAMVSLPFHYFSFIIASYRLFRKTSSYFRDVNMKRLTECYKPGEQGCVDCLTKIFNFEKEMLNYSLKFINYRFIGWGFRGIVDTLEDRAETLTLSTDEMAVKAINNFIDKAEKGELGNYNWKEQMNAL